MKIFTHKLVIKMSDYDYGEDDDDKMMRWWDNNDQQLSLIVFN